MNFLPQRAYILNTQFLRFTLVGIASTTTTYAILIIGVECLRINAIAASGIGYALGATINYLLNYGYTFKNNQSHHIVIPKFLVVTAAGMFVNIATMHACMNSFGMHYMAAQLMAITAVLFLSFTANRLWTFAN